MAPPVDRRGSAEAALAAWGTFPAAAASRPLVLIGQSVLVPDVFPSDAAKRAFLRRRFQVDCDVPEDVLTAVGPAVHSVPDDSALPWLRIVDASEGTAAFLTDRGEADLPAWRLTLADVRAAMWVLDPGVAASCWRTPGVPETTSPLTVKLADDDRTLTVGFLPVPEGADFAGSVEAIESAQAVVLIGPGDGLVPDGATAVLAVPLGARVVVDATDGTPVRVLRDRPIRDAAPPAAGDLRFTLRVLADQQAARGELSTAATTARELLRHLTETARINRDDCFAISRTARRAGEHDLELHALQAWQELFRDRAPSHGEAVALAMAFFALALAASSLETAHAAFLGGEAVARSLPQHPDALTRVSADAAARLTGRS